MASRWIASLVAVGVATGGAVVLAQPAPICPQPSLDVDGDGSLDAFVEVRDSRGTGGAEYEVRLTNHGRPRSAGRVQACTLRLGSQSSHGATDLVAVWRVGAMHAVESVLRFDGARYRVVRERACRNETCR